MGLMDKVRAQGTQLAQIAQETAREGKVKLDQAQAKRRADAMFRDLGAAVYAERTGRATPDTKDRIDRLVDALSRQEASQGLGDPDTPPPDGPPSDAPPPRRRGRAPALAAGGRAWALGCPSGCGRRPGPLSGTARPGMRRPPGPASPLVTSPCTRSTRAGRGPC